MTSKQESTADARASIAAILHVDIDAFYVSVEQRRDPSLRNRKVMVSGTSPRSVVLSASYEARALGVRSAMPVGTARRLCPDVLIVPPDMAAYRVASRSVMKVFSDFTELVEPISVDEAFLDVRAAIRRLGSPLKIGQLIRERLRGELELPATVGIAETKFVAKIASTHAKPDGLLLIPPEHTIAFLHSLPVRALWGVGEKTREVLARLGIATVADVANTPVANLRSALGATGEHVHRLSWGLDPRRVNPERSEKSMGAEETFSRDIHDSSALERELLRLSHRTAARLRASNLQARTVSIKVRYADFTTLTRSHSVTEPIDSSARLHSISVALLRALGDRPQSVRLIGLRAEHLVDAAGTSEQLSIDRQENNWRTAERALDEVHRRYGSTSVSPARLLSSPDASGREGRTVSEDRGSAGRYQSNDDARRRGRRSERHDGDPSEY